MTLADLTPTFPATITSLDASGPALELMKLGMVPQTRVRVIRRAPLGGPIEVDVQGARFAIRVDAAATVQVELIAS